MKLYIARHGLAVPKDENLDCPLSERGRRDIARMASFLARTRPKLSRIIHSGKTRALQTALIYSENIGPGRVVEEVLEGLNPDDDVISLARAAVEWEADVMIVSHLPLVGRLVAHLITDNSDQSLVHFLPGTVACLDRGNVGWTIAWIIGPDLLGG
ncbi:MAG: phosphohistidine phosphatase SixA [Rhodospirillaceae bacterium TMED8]|nr:phosphohistidine phosphatase SixA [Magnetovibrio sp.]OUT48584.1 MAG: phosphohistidine phosphatase SixA [Rhodospirillaceae bacterium TMED8]|tara:strand:- start:2252 stop:2719 length:468 start_codon:yes stop_codon:yes gene_type:complete